MRKIVEYFRGLSATVEIMLDPGFAVGIRKSIEDKKRGRVHSFDEVFGEPLAR